MKRLALFIMMSLLNGVLLFSQVSINTDGNVPDNSAMLEVKSTNKGFLPPRMTQAQIGTISNPADGLMVFCTTDSKLYIYISATYQWREVPFGTGIITPPFSCGMPIIINHVAGNVAPVSKTVTYGTVTNIPGETSKCWITSNLGADHQATAVNDAIEASAGWYWQFNRMQGYKHDGTTRTPNTTWLAINENSDWLAINDPCSLELGGIWRIPTSTEYTNIDEIGGWNDWYGPWNSNLKLHAAGFLYAATGALGGRGTSGYYYSSTQYSNTTGWLFNFYNADSHMVYYNSKAVGTSLRCIKD